MPEFLHFYPGFDYDAYRRLPFAKWLRLTEYMRDAMKAAQR